MKNYYFLKLFFGLLIFIPKMTYAIDPPKITATGNQTYCPGTNAKIVSTVTLSDPNNLITEIYIQISTGYMNGQDQLILTNPISHPTIGADTFDPTTGKLRIYGIGASATSADFEAAIKDVVFYNSSPSPSGTREFSITIGQANYLPRNKHFYRYVSNAGIKWTDAKVAAESPGNYYYGLQGYLATLTAADEAQLAGAQAPGAGWIGGSDAVKEGEWKWVTGPEGLANGGTGTIFWNGAANGSTPNFAFWNNYEPNDYSGANPDTTSGDENYAHITTPGMLNGIKGSWNDLPNTGDTNPNSPYHPKGYIVEYGGMAPGDVDNLQISASTTMTISQITSTTPSPICSSGTFTLQATTSTGTINWHDASSGGNFLGTGNSYTTPSISATTTYYVDNGCPTRTPIIATVNIIPDAPSIKIPTSICGSGTVTLEASTNAGIISWFTTPIGVSDVANGTYFTTPILTQNTTYYAEAINNGCSNGIRIPVDIIVYTPPVVTDQEVVLCKSQTVTLDAQVTGMNYLWSPTGETTQQITVSTSGIYTVDVTSPSPENCTSRKKITVVEHNVPEIDRIDVNETTVVIYLKQEEPYFEFSVDGINYQSSNVFFNVPSGLQTAYVREVNRCSSDSRTFIVLIIPKFFTPNNDTYNDFWEVKGLINYPEAEVTIFDRYGKFIIQLNASRLTWDGTYNKQPLPATDYWYVLKIDKTRPEMRGHFSLKR